MNARQFESFAAFRDEFRAAAGRWLKYAGRLEPLQKEAAQKDTPDYPLETPVVYNKALDDITEDSSIRLIVIGDNPGKDEQRTENQRYLVGQSGKIADGFFKKNPELGVDFRKNVLILNKTPVHTAKTSHLRMLQKADSSIAALIEESQIWMACHTARLHQELIANAGDSCIPQVWLVGYAELKGKGIFLPYRDMLKESYSKNAEAWNNVCVYQHFSMNRFSIDLNKYRTDHPGLALSDSLAELGRIHRDEIFTY